MDIIDHNRSQSTLMDPGSDLDPDIGPDPPTHRRRLVRFWRSLYSVATEKTMNGTFLDGTSHHHVKIGGGLADVKDLLAEGAKQI